MFFPGENEKSRRNYYIVPRVTTHNSACVINGLKAVGFLYEFLKTIIVVHFRF